MAQELIWQKPLLVQMVVSLKYGLCILYVFETFKRHMAQIQAKESYHFSLLVHILGDRFMPFSFNSQNNLKFLSCREEMTNSHRDSRATLLNQIICYSVQKWIDWNQNLVKQIIWLMPLIIKNIKYWKQLTQLNLTWDICTLSLLFMLAWWWSQWMHTRGCIDHLTER